MANQSAVWRKSHSVRTVPEEGIHRLHIVGVDGALITLERLGNFSDHLRDIQFQTVHPSLPGTIDI
jgi:hypothetical protein